MKWEEKIFFFPSGHAAQSHVWAHPYHISHLLHASREPQITVWLCGMFSPFRDGGYQPPKGSGLSPLLLDSSIVAVRCGSRDRSHARLSLPAFDGGKLCFHNAESVVYRGLGLPEDGVVGVVARYDGNDETVVDGEARKGKAGEKSQRAKVHRGDEKVRPT